MSKPSTHRRGRSGCPICGAPANPAQTPFCSQGCRDRDLLNWLGEGYAIPGSRADVAQEIDPDGLDSDA